MLAKDLNAQPTPRWKVQLRACTGPVLEKSVPPFIPPHNPARPKRAEIAELVKMIKIEIKVTFVILAEIIFLHFRVKITFRPKMHFCDFGVQNA